MEGGPMVAAFVEGDTWRSPSCQRVTAEVLRRLPPDAVVLADMDSLAKALCEESGRPVKLMSGGPPGYSVEAVRIEMDAHVGEGAPRVDGVVYAFGAGTKVDAELYYSKKDPDVRLRLFMPSPWARKGDEFTAIDRRATSYGWLIGRPAALPRPEPVEVPRLSVQAALEQAKALVAQGLVLPPGEYALRMDGIIAGLTGINPRSDSTTKTAEAERWLIAQSFDPGVPRSPQERHDLAAVMAAEADLATPSWLREVSAPDVPEVK